MKILGIDSSARSASAAVVEDGRILSSFFINAGLTHSQTLMPMVDNALKCADIKLDEIELVAVNNGPGSFTGVRIGVAAAKGICDTLKIDCCPISTLESMAYNLLSFNCIACAVMDARCNQVYVALFDITDGEVKRITKDSALSIDDLGDMLKTCQKKVYFVGDGADLCHKILGQTLDNAYLPAEAYKYQNAVGVCLAAEKCDKSRYINSDKLIPEYLRLPQAERELKNKLKKGE